MRPAHAPLPSGCLWRHHQRQLFADFLKTGLCGALRASHHLWDGKQPQARKCRISLSLVSDGVVYTTALHSLSSMPVVPSARDNGPYSGSINTGLIILKKFDVHSKYVLGGWRRRFRQIILHGYSSTYVQILELVESDDFRMCESSKTPRIPAHPSSLIKWLLAESLRKLEPTKFFPQSNGELAVF